ncbi:hypothetical protein W59_18664 [Rhodococcus opacus RKJ300 = JCM 13270]|uniref:Uncharacterized protein n=1 Tax=Rhodococcus opacus RKJ300 = JCM 13270 TaxID=1165867 RepID=I0WQE7_RHOOP|nr:hypothetical protein W59_18664 [Rhodococcus opacus RKJ300 = JCM 13270]
MGGAVGDGLTNLSLVKSNSVGAFAGQYSQVASNLRDMIVQYQATSSAQIVQAGLASGDQDAAEVLVFLDQTVTTRAAAGNWRMSNCCNAP